MPVIVPSRFAFPARAGIVSGRPVRGIQHTAIGDALNYLRGHSRVLCPAMRVGGVVNNSTTETYTLPMQFAEWMTHVVWFLRFRVSSETATVVFTDPSGGTSTVVVGEVDADVRIRSGGFFHVETIDPITDTAYLAPPREFTIARTDANAGALTVETIAVKALGRSSLGFDDADGGVDVRTLFADTPIFTASGSGESLGALVRAMAAQDDPADHGYTDRHLFAYVWPQDQGIAVNASWVPVFEEGPVVQASHRHIGETLRRVFVAATGYVDTPGDTIEVRFTAASGDTVTEIIAATSSGAWGFPVELDVYAEDLSTADGRRASTDEIVTIEARCTGAGSNDGFLEGLCIYESRIAT